MHKISKNQLLKPIDFERKPFMVIPESPANDNLHMKFVDTDAEELKNL